MDHSIDISPKAITREELRVLPGVLSLLPLVYIAWADAVLKPSEIELIKQYVDDQNWLDEHEKELIESWLNPKDPPGPQLMKTWFRVIRDTVENIPPEHRGSLAEIGIQLANLSPEKADRCSTVEACKALEFIEDSLGVIGKESYADLIQEERDKEIVEWPKAGFSSAKMQEILDGEDVEIIERVKKILSDPVFEYSIAPGKEEYREKVLEWARLLADQGLGAIAYPKEYGGAGSMKDYFATMETLSYHDLSLVVKFGVQFGLFGMSVYFLGTKKHHEKYLHLIGNLELPGCFAMTETGHGSNVRDIETTATYDQDSDEFIINTPHAGARKDYIGNAAAHGQMATVFAQMVIGDVEYGVSAFLASIRNSDGTVSSGVEIEDCGEKMGLNGVDNGRLKFSEVRIPRENLLDRFAQVSRDGIYTSPISGDDKRFFTMLGTLVGGRIGIPRAGLSAAKSALTIVLRYAARRRQFGPPGEKEVAILNYKSHQKRLIPLLARAYAMHFSLQYLTERYLKKTREDEREIEALAAGLKAYCTWNTTEIIQECREACGGQGYLAENRFSALKNDTEIFMTFEGDNTVLMQLVAKGRLTEFKQEFHNINFFGILRYVSGQAAKAFVARNPVIVRNTDKEHLLDHDFHLDIFKYREQDILISAARRFKKYLDEGMSSFEAFNECQLHMIQVGMAYIERVILEQFIEKLTSINDEKLKVVLDKLCSVYALSTIELYKGWYLENNYMEGVKTKAIRKLINELNKELKNESVELVNAFGIPDHLLSAPIGIQKNA